MYELVAIGNALVDTEFKITDSLLTQTTLTKGAMTLAGTDEQSALFDVLAGHDITPSKQAGGGSAGNTAACFAALGGKAHYHCRVAHDKHGVFYLDDMTKMGVSINHAKTQVDGTTGSCVVLVTDDGERTMQTNLAVSSEIDESNVDFETLSGAKFLYLEGYLAMSPSVQPAITHLCQTAKEQGIQIVVSFSDPAVVRFAKEGLLSWLSHGVDTIFCNMDEAKLFAGTDDEATAVQALLAHTQKAVITNGAKPTTIATKDGTRLHEVPSTDVVDTNGAGDNFAGAFLYGQAQGLDDDTCVKLATLVASRIVMQFGARLDKADYQTLKNTLL